MKWLEQQPDCQHIEGVVVHHKYPRVGWIYASHNILRCFHILYALHGTHLLIILEYGQLSPSKVFASIDNRLNTKHY